MYATDRIHPNSESHEVHRLPEGTGTSPVSSQTTDNFQLRTITVVCATHHDVVRILRFLQDSEWKYDVNDNTAPIQEGLNLFQGTLTAKRYLPLSTRDDGAYIVNAEF